MKEGWKYKKLGDLCDIYQPATIAASKLSVDGKYPVYGANGIIGRHNEYNHEEAEVLLGCRGTCGVVNMSQPFSWINGNAMVIRPTKDTFSKVFLMYLLRSLDYSHIITGTAQPQITQTTLRPTEVPVPSLTEQQSIVEYLDTSFAKIDTMKANAEKALNEANALYQSTLNELLEPKEGWKIKKMQDLGTSKVGPFGSLLHKSDYISDGVPLINPMHIYNGCIKEDYKFSVGRDKYNELQLYILQEGDIIIGRRGEMGRCAVVRREHSGFICGTGSIFFRPNTKIVFPNFLQLQLSSKRMVARITEVAGGATMLNLSSKSLNSIEVEVPCISAQQSIVDTLDSLKSKADQLQANYDKISQECDTLKQSILKQVFE